MNKLKGLKAVGRSNRMRAILDMKCNRAALALLAAVVLPVAMLHAAESPASAKTSAATGAGWGEPVEGLSVQLWAEKAVWDLAQPHHFKVSVRNQGRQTFSVARTQVAGELEVDGVWYVWSNPIYVTFAPLAPGGQVENIPLNTVGGAWRKDLNVLTAGPGKHTIRFAVLARQENGGQVIRAVSNLLEVEFRWAANATKLPVTFIPGDAPVIADIQGRVVDDETDALITDFWVQAGVANPEKPGEIIWSQMFTGPWMGRPSWFGVQGRKRGQTWRVLADGYLPQTVTKHPIADPMQAFDLVVRLKRGGELHGIVLDHMGQPVVGARVFLTTEKTPEFTDGIPGKTFRGSSTSTDATGRFALRGVGEAEPKVVVVSADGLQVCPAAKPEPGQDLRITLPRPAALIVRYSIPGDEANAELSLTLWTSEMGSSGWNGVQTALKPKVANGGQVVLTNLTPGRYEFYRTKMLHADGGSHGIPYERRTIVLDAGQTQQVDLVRSVGHPVQGKVTGLDHTGATGGYIYVRSAIATGNPRDMMEGLLPCFDALTFGTDGVFRTARLEPGTYTIVAHVYGPEPIEFRHRTGIRLPGYFGTAKVTVTAADPPPPIKIELQPK
jgi:hypothetical protein